MEEHVPPLDAWDEATGITFEEYITLEENMEMCGELSNQDILEEVLNKKSGVYLI